MWNWIRGWWKPSITLYLNGNVKLRGNLNVQEAAQITLQVVLNGYANQIATELQKDYGANAAHQYTSSVDNEIYRLFSNMISPKTKSNNEQISDGPVIPPSKVM